MTQPQRLTPALTRLLDFKNKQREAHEAKMRFIAETIDERKKQAFDMEKSRMEGSRSRAEVAGDGAEEEPFNPADIFPEQAVNVGNPGSTGRPEGAFAAAALGGQATPTQAGNLSQEALAGLVPEDITTTQTGTEFVPFGRGGAGSFVTSPRVTTQPNAMTPAQAMALIQSQRGQQGQMLAQTARLKLLERGVRVEEDKQALIRELAGGRIAGSGNPFLSGGGLSLSGLGLGGSKSKTVMTPNELSTRLSDLATKLKASKVDPDDLGPILLQINAAQADPQQGNGRVTAIKPKGGFAAFFGKDNVIASIPLSDIEENLAVAEGRLEGNKDAAKEWLVGSGLFATDADDNIVQNEGANEQTGRMLLDFYHGINQRLGGRLGGFVRVSPPAGAPPTEATTGGATVVEPPPVPESEFIGPRLPPGVAAGRGVRAAIARADETALDVLARGVVGAGRAGQAATGFLSGLLFNVEQERMALDQKLASIDTQRSKDAAGNLGAILQNFMKGIPEQIAMSERLRSVDAPGRAIQSASSASGIPEQVLRSIARIESNFDPNARGAAGEIGMFQIMPEVATTLLRRVGAPTQNVEAMLRDPKQSAGLAAQLLRELVAQVGLTGPAEDPRSWANVVQAYNLGQPKYAKGLRVPEYLSRFLQAAGE